jgi:hypothetical protein
MLYFCTVVLSVIQGVALNIRVLPYKKVGRYIEGGLILSCGSRHGRGACLRGAGGVGTSRYRGGRGVQV